MESQPHTLTGPIFLAMLKLLRGSKAGGTIRSPCLTSCTSHTIVFHPLIHVLSQITQIWLKCIFYKGIQIEYKALQDEEEKPLFFSLGSLCSRLNICVRFLIGILWYWLPAPDSCSASSH